MNRKGCALGVFGCLLCIPLILMVGIRIYTDISFDIKCKDFLKRASDANTVKMAKEELDKSIKYLDEHNMTKGYTSVLYKDPHEDVEFFYNNITSARAELNNVNDSDEATQRLVLIKLRETLVDHKGEKGVNVTCPDGLARYPYNTFYYVLTWLFGILAVIGIFCVLCFLIELDK